MALLRPFSEYGFMQELPYYNRISEHRKTKGLTQHDLADLLGVHWVTISKLERGKMQLTLDWIVKLAGALDVRPIEIMPFTGGGFVSRDFPIMGAIGAGGSVAEARSTVSYAEWVPERKTEIWWQIDSDDYEPYYFKGDLLQVQYEGGGDISKFCGRLGVIEGRGKIVFAILERRLDNGNYDLRTIQGLAIKDFKVFSFGFISNALHRTPDGKQIGI
jgi:transcriptional regulator with XRE-family HTH domain